MDIVDEAARDARTRARAYMIWEAEGRPEGRAEEHWCQAERELAAEPTPESATGAASTPKRNGRRSTREPSRS